MEEETLIKWYKKDIERIDEASTDEEKAKILHKIYNRGFEDGCESYEDCDCDEDREPMYNEGYD